jgi:hypothetical protein
VCLIFWAFGCSGGNSSRAPSPTTTATAPPPDVPASGGFPSIIAAAGGTPASAGGATQVPGSGGVPGHDPGLFGWPEGNPDGGTLELCKPGHYVGTYECAVKPPPAFAAFFPGDAGTGYLVNGAVDLVLNQSQSGEFLTVSGGTLKSTAQLFFALEAMVAGQLNCQTGVFSGQLVSGTVAIPPFPPGGTFDGPLSATFDPKAAALEGKWNLIGGATFQGTSCSGPWTATWQGP